MPATRQEIIKRRNAIIICLADLGFNAPIDINKHYLRNCMSIRTLPNMPIIISQSIGLQFIESFIINHKQRIFSTSPEIIPDEYLYAIIDRNDNNNCLCRFDYSLSHVSSLKKEFHPTYHFHLKDYCIPRFPTPRVDLFSIMDLLLRNHYETKWLSKDKCKCLKDVTSYFRVCRDCEYAKEPS